MKLRLWALALLCGASAGAHADAEHDRIASDRTAANARLAQHVRTCETRFIVAPCLEEARKENRAALAELRQHEIKLDEARRRTVGEARRKAIAEKAEAAQQNRATDALPDEPRVRMRREPPEAARPATHAVEAPSMRAPEADIVRPLQAQRSQARFDARAREARAHREAVARRNAQRAAQGKVVAPLPLPAGASAPR